MKLVVTMSPFASQALAGEEGHDADRVPSRVVRAIRTYLSDKELNRPGWPYPSFTRDDGGAREEVELQISVENEVWSAFEAEARRQGVSTEQLLEHAALYFAAEIDSGRLTTRILEDAEEDPP